MPDPMSPTSVEIERGDAEPSDATSIDYGFDDDLHLFCSDRIRRKARAFKRKANGTPRFYPTEGGPFFECDTDSRERF